MMTANAIPSLVERLAEMREHIMLLHPTGTRGKIATARQTPDGGWDEGLIGTSRRAIDDQIANADIQFVSQARFSGRRHNKSVQALRVAYQDLDYTNEGLPHAHRLWREVVWISMAAYEAAGIPQPSYFTFSGRGIHAVWIFDGLSRDALPRWHRAMRDLRGPRLDAEGNVASGRRKLDERTLAWHARMLPVWRTMRDLGLDRGACDVARVLRVWGSINPKSGEMARRAWPAAIADIKPACFDAFCDSVMAFKRSEIQAIRAERRVWKAANSDYVRAPRKVRRTATAPKWAAVYADMMALLDHRGSIKVGQRMYWTLITAIAISQTEGGCAEKWAERLAPLVGLPVREVEISLSGVERTMLAHEAGETTTHEGKVRPAFYDYAYETIADRLKITAEDVEAAGLTVLVPGGGATVRTAAERQREWRDAQNPGRLTLDLMMCHKFSDGVAFLHARASGVTFKEISESLRDAGRPHSVPYIKEAMALAEAELRNLGDTDLDLDPVAAPAPDSRKAGRDRRIVSQPIVALSPVYSPASIQAPPAPASIPDGMVEVRRHTPFFVEYRTATARWTLFRYRPFGIMSGWDEMRDDLPLDGPDMAPCAVYLVPLSETLTGVTAPALRGLRAIVSRPVHTASRRRPSGCSSARFPASLPSLDVAHGARLYHAATRGS